MSDSEEGSNENNRSNGNNGNNVSFDNPLRGYSRRHSYYDNAFNMDFEYSYLELMSNYGTFVSRTHEMYSNMETCISGMIEVQKERRLSVNRRRERAGNNRRVHEQQHLVFDNDDFVFDLRRALETVVLLWQRYCLTMIHRYGILNCRCCPA